MYLLQSCPNTFEAIYMLSPNLQFRKSKFNVHNIYINVVVNNVTTNQITSKLKERGVGLDCMNHILFDKGKNYIESKIAFNSHDLASRRTKGKKNVKASN